MRATRWVLLSVVVGLCCLSVAPALASDARLEALSVQREYVEDYFNFRTFPTVVARYQNLVQVGLGSRDSDGDFLDDMSVGVIGAGDGTSYGVFALYLNEVNRDGVEQQQLDLTWAKAFSTTTIGATVVYTNSEIKDNTGDIQTPINSSPGDLDNANANFFGLNAGVKIDMSGNSMLEIAAGIGFYGWDDTLSGVGRLEDDGKVSYLVSARIFSEITNRTTLVPLLKYQKMDLTSKPVGTATSEEYSRTMINLGVALHYEVNGNDLLILGLSVDNIKDKDGTEEMSVWSTPNLFAALEFDIYSWLTARAGVTKGFENTNIKDTAATTGNELDIKASEYRFGLGMGLHFDHFDVDATVDPEALFTGSYFLSGESSQPLTRITATYYF